MLFQLVLLKLSAVQKTVKLLWVAYLSLYLSLFSLRSALSEFLSLADWQKSTYSGHKIIRTIRLYLAKNHHTINQM
jgi:hypothetical protein